MANPTPSIPVRRGTHPNMEVLRAVYDDLACIGEFCADDVVLHPADREVTGGLVVGKEAVTDWEVNLIRLTGGTLVMDVDDITANGYFGAVTGVLRAQPGDREVAMPFCGLWRFRDGLLVEHWENAYEPAALAGLLTDVPRGA
jgi:ketosteroid isomerase-like protein